MEGSASPLGAGLPPPTAHEALWGVSGILPLSRPVEQADPLTYLLFLFQELTMNKFKLTWGLLSGILPTV